MITNEVIIDSIATGQNIKKLMKLHNHSVAHLSKLSGLSPTTITNYRSGYNVPNLHKSSPMFQWLMYSLSSSTTSSKSVMLLRPLTCHIPVRPGFAARRAR